MLTRIWGGVSSAIGGLMLVLLVVYGTHAGTWADEVGPLRADPPSLVPLFAIGVLALVLLVGGLITALTGPGRR